MEKNICVQCGKEFETWPRVEDYSVENIIDIQIVDENDICSMDCYNEWRSDNRLELCN